MATRPQAERPPCARRRQMGRERSQAALRAGATLVRNMAPRQDACACVRTDGTKALEALRARISPFPGAAAVFRRPSGGAAHRVARCVPVRRRYSRAVGESSAVGVTAARFPRYLVTAQTAACAMRPTSTYPPAHVSFPRLFLRSPVRQVRRCEQCARCRRRRRRSPGPDDTTPFVHEERAGASR